MFLSDNVNIEVLSAEYGNSIFMSIHKENKVFNILVDGGLASTYYSVKDIRSDFKNKDPRLNVSMYSVKEEYDTIGPNLYFSIVKINILFFCIFLVKASYAKTDKNEDLGCIFLDDPIQA